MSDYRPPLPPGREVDLPGRGTTFFREVPGPPGAPTVVLLHGWTVTADLNWFPAYDALGAHFRVIALDHRGHGRGIKSRRRFRLADCADDVAALTRHVGIDRFIAVGYSMGGIVAQLLWHRHPDRLRGLVLGATARNFRGTRGETAWFRAVSSVAGASRAVPDRLRRTVAGRLTQARAQGSPAEEWVVEQLSSGDPRMIVEAGAAIGRFSSAEWIGGVDVPSAVIVTTRDEIVPPERQVRLAGAIPGSATHEVDIEHSGCVTDADRFVPALVDACVGVRHREERARRAPPTGASGSDPEVGAHA